MQKNYDQSTEQVIYSLWESVDAFNPDSRPSAHNTQFSIIMPPPNANDPLHVGHAMFVSIEDVLIRYHRMLGDDTVWIPGTDHAGIETQYVFEKKLAKTGQSRFQFDRETLYSKIMEYVQENSGVAIDQMKRLGASADWSRFHFTLEPKIVEFVLKTFDKLYSDDLVYRDLKLVNFCTKCGTSYSDLEINHIDQTSPLYFIRYKMVKNPDEYLVVATTRPEPIFVDTHLAVHPDNPKTQHLIGKKVLNPLTNLEMEILADEFVDPEFGTGIVKLTPAHDFADFDVAKKHHLPIVSAIDTQGKIVASGGKLAGLKIEPARKRVLEILKEKDLIEKIDEKYQNRIGVCYRCNRIIEPLPLPQFFINVQPLAQKALQALDSGETTIHGAGREKILRHWLENLRDWNISRQIVWGIRMPVWYSVNKNPDLQITFLDKNGERHMGIVSELLKLHPFVDIEKGLQQLLAPAHASFVVSSTKPDDNSNNNFLQETDTFDTWFSSGQWPVVTLTQDHNDLKSQSVDSGTTSSDFQRYYPTSVMETGYDILPFWVMRMMLLSIYLTDKSPFSDVYLHGLVRDEKGQKMSKSKGNVINPIDLTEKYGADALRMALIMSTTPGSDSAVGESKVKGMRNFSNKIWNASRFVLMALEGDNSEVGKKSNELKDKSYEQRDTEQTQNAPIALDSDAAFYEKLDTVVGEVTKQLNDLKIGLATETVYGAFWHWFCDECIEHQKQGKLSIFAIVDGLITFLRLLHPFAPFVTESVWQEMRKSSHLLILEKNLEATLISARWPGED